MAVIRITLKLTEQKFSQYLLNNPLPRNGFKAHVKTSLIEISYSHLYPDSIEGIKLESMSQQAFGPYPLFSFFSLRFSLMVIFFFFLGSRWLLSRFPLSPIIPPSRPIT